MQAIRRLVTYRTFPFFRPSALFSGKDPKKQFEEALASMKKKVK